MNEQELALVEEAYRQALPNIVYAAELKELVDQTTKLAQISEVISLLKEKISSTSDMTRKTDLRIFLTQLQRLIAKEKGINSDSP